MTQNRQIIDNRGRKVFEHLKECLPEAILFRAVSAYFSIYGYELLEKELEDISDIRLLFGNPEAAEGVDPGNTQQKAFEITEDRLEPQFELEQGFLARRCRKWFQKESVEVRSMRMSGFLHGKVYHTEGGKGDSAVLGSSNFTKRGLGGSKNSNIEINIASTEAEFAHEVRDWFDDLWSDDELTEDIKQKILESLDRVGAEQPPEVIYFKVLYEIFKNEFEAMSNQDQSIADIELKDTEIWKKLYGFQREGAKTAIRRLQLYNGCILADSVGLGKTYTALAVIKYFERKNERVLVLAPKKIRENWSLYPVNFNHKNNPFLNDRFQYSLLSHTDLSRYSGEAYGIDLGNFNWENFDLIVIDESHNFRNSTPSRKKEDGTVERLSRYNRLLNEVIKKGINTKVLLLSATPVNTSLMDLRNQVSFMTGGDPNFYARSMGIKDINGLFQQAQKKFKEWEEKSDNKNRNKGQLQESLGANFLKLLGNLSISRSRKHVVKFYGTEISEIGNFPKKEKPDNRYTQTDTEGHLSYKDLSTVIDEFKLSVYMPSSYLTAEEQNKALRQEAGSNFNQVDREKYLVAMLKVNFLKRLESSVYSFTETLSRVIGKITGLLDKIHKFEAGEVTGEIEVEMPDIDEEDDEFAFGTGKRPYHLNQINLKLWKQALESDKMALTKALDSVRVIDPTRDAKLQQLKREVEERVNEPTITLDGVEHRKMLVFTTFKDSASYLYDNLKEVADEHGIKMALVSGDETKTMCGDNNFHSILDNFAPRARSRVNNTGEEIDILIATDCISEGQNLQDCDVVVNYDIHWNPVRLVQRLGRIDRIGSRNKRIRMINYWPTKDLDEYLLLENRVKARMALVDATASGHDDPFDESLFDEEQAREQLKFRDTQLERIRDEALDMNDLSDSVNLSDFSFDHFLAQLKSYLEQNKDRLERVPFGAYAVTQLKGSCQEPGAIFVLKLRHFEESEFEKGSSPFHPYYLVHIGNSGTIRLQCIAGRRILNLFDELAAGICDPILELCNKFNRETEHGKNMLSYEKLLCSAIDDVRRTHGRHMADALTQDATAVLPRSKSSPSAKNNFQLVAWLVVKS